MALTPGSRLGPYEIVAPLGEGAMGEVYRATDTNLARQVAIKVLPESFAQDPERLARFDREAKTLAALNHPNIAHIHGLERTGGTIALVMELVEGKDLAQRIERGPIPVDDALSIARQIADALEAAHEQGIIHRDLKPANIKVRDDGTVKVLDFGLAKALGGPSGPSGPTGSNAFTVAPTIAGTEAGMILGTAAYMSPEQARGQAVDARTDLWAFGCVLFEMLSGARAIRGDTVTDVLAAVVKDEPRWGDLPADTPASIHRLLRRCLTKDRRKRLASAADARLEIEDVVETPPAGATPQTARGRSPWTLGLGFAAAIAAAAGAYALGARGAIAPSSPAPITRFVIDAPPGTQIVTGHRELDVSSDGQQVAFIARGAGGQYIYVRRVDTLTAQQVPGTEGARDLAFSPDGRWLAFHAANKIRKVRLDGTLPAVLADAVHSHGLAWHPTEDAIYYAPHQLSPIWKVQANGETPAKQVTTLDAARGERSHEWPVFADGGRMLLFSTNANGAGLDETTASLLTLSTNVRTSIRASGVFGFTDRRELLFVRGRSVVGARYDDGRLAPPEVLDPATVGLPVLSSTGTLAYVPAPDYQRRSLLWISPDGQTSESTFGQRAFQGIALSPDGRRVALGISDDRDDALYVADIGGGQLTAVARPGVGTPSWSPDSKWIAGDMRSRETNSQIFARVAAEPGRNWEPLFTGTVEDGLSQWMPNGQGLLFTRRDSPTGRRVPMRLAINATPPTASVIVDSVRDQIAQSPSLSPDGRWLAYESNETGRLEVYVQSYPSATARIQVSRDGGSWPTWTKHGDAIYFIAGSAIMSTAITTQPELRSAAPRLIVNDPLFVPVIAGARPFDVAPDGRILAIREDGSIRSDHIVVVQNWLNEAQARKVDGQK